MRTLACQTMVQNALCWRSHLTCLCFDKPKLLCFLLGNSSFHYSRGNEHAIADPSERWIQTVCLFCRQRQVVRLQLIFSRRKVQSWPESKSMQSLLPGTSIISCTPNSGPRYIQFWLSCHFVTGVRRFPFGILKMPLFDLTTRGLQE